MLYSLDTLSRRARNTENDRVGIHGNRSGAKHLQTFQGPDANINYKRPRRGNPMEGTIDHAWIEKHANENFLIYDNPAEYTIFSVKFQKKDFDEAALAYLGDDEFEADVEINNGQQAEGSKADEEDKGEQGAEKQTMCTPAS